MAAVGLAILYFALVELMLIDSARELKEARRFRAKVVAATLAENGAEYAAVEMTSRPGGVKRGENDQGSYSGRLTKIVGGDEFILSGEGTAEGTDRTRARVELRGVISGGNVTIRYAVHSY